MNPLEGGEVGAEGVNVPFVVILGSRKIYKKAKICRNSCIKENPL